MGNQSCFLHVYSSLLVSRLSSRLVFCFRLLLDLYFRRVSRLAFRLLPFVSLSSLLSPPFTTLLLSHVMMDHIPPSLDTLPVEVLSTIFCLLDPIGLIAVCQTNTRFRAVVDPQPIHFVERLLQLECGPHGGGNPTFRVKDNHLTPNPASDEWESIRWACSVCLRLLPHEDFSNHYLFRLAYRKPLPGSPAQNPLTSWAPSKRKGPAIARQIAEKQAIEDKEERKMKRRYELATKYDWRPRSEVRLRAFQASGMITFQSVHTNEYLELMSEKEENARLDQEAHWVEFARCGFRRYMRKCNECRFKDDEIASHVSHPSSAGRPVQGYELGTSKVPIVISRQYPFENALERYFPGVDEALKFERPVDESLDYTSHWDDQGNKLWTTYNVRCPSCSLWQEMREFRVGGVFNRWAPKIWPQGTLCNWDGTKLTPEFIDNLQCNYCYALANGREKLRAVLVKWLNLLLDKERSRLGGMMFGAWERLLRRKRDGQNFRHYPDIRKVISRVEEFFDHFDEPRNFGTCTLDDIKMSRILYDEWVIAWEDMQENRRQGVVYPNNMDTAWYRHYDSIEARLIWAIGCQAKLTVDGDVLVDWALNV